MAYAENCLQGIQKVLNYHSNRTYDDKVSYFQQGIYIFRYLFNILWKTISCFGRHLSQKIKCFGFSGSFIMKF